MVHFMCNLFNVNYTSTKMFLKTPFYKKETNKNEILFTA